MHIATKISGQIEGKKYKNIPAAIIAILLKISVFAERNATLFKLSWLFWNFERIFMHKRFINNAPNPTKDKSYESGYDLYINCCPIAHKAVNPGIKIKKARNILSLKRFFKLQFAEKKIIVLIAVSSRKSIESANNEAEPIL